MLKNNKSKILFLLLLIGFFLRFFTTNCYLWDEFVNLQQAEVFSGKFNNYDEFSFRPQFLSYLISVLYYFWHDPLIANLLLTVMSTLSILLIYLLVKEMFDINIAIFSAILLTFSPLHVYYSHYIVTNNPGLFFGLLSLYFLKRGESNGKLLNFALAGLFLSCAIITRFDYLIFVPIYATNCIIFFRSYKIRDIIVLLTGFIVGMLPYLAWTYTLFGNPFIPFEYARDIVDRVKNVNPDRFLYLRKIDTLAGPFGIIGFCYWVFLTSKNRSISKNELILLILFLVPFIYLSNMSLKDDRYLIITLTGFITLSSIGLCKISEFIKNSYLYLYAILIAAGSMLYTLSNNDFRLLNDYCIENEMSLSTWINNNIPNNSPIYMLRPLYPAIGYYIKNPLIDVHENKESFFHVQPEKNSYFILYEEQIADNPSWNIDDLKLDPKFKLIKTLYLPQKVYIFSILPTK